MKTLQKEILCDNKAAVHIANHHIADWEDQKPYTLVYISNDISFSHCICVYRWPYGDISFIIQIRLKNNALDDTMKNKFSWSSRFFWLI